MSEGQNETSARRAFTITPVVTIMRRASGWLFTSENSVRDIVYAIGGIDKDRVDNDHDCIYLSIYGLYSLLLEMLPEEDDVWRDAACDKDYRKK